MQIYIHTYIHTYIHLSYIHTSNFPVLKGRLLFSLGTSRPPVYFWNLPIWDDPGLNVRYLWILQVHHTFYKFDVKILAPSNEILPLTKKAPGMSLKTKFVIFKPWKILWNKIDYYISHCYIRWILKQVLKNRTQIQLSRGIIRESKRSWRVHFSGFQRA